MDFARVLAESGLTKIDLANLYGVSRQTIHGWAFIGPPRVGSLLARHAEVITQALIAAIERGLLPLEATSKAARRERVAKMAARLQGLKPAPVR